MIISASRRTDIPNYYSEWFMNRIKERYVLARNPMNPHQVSRVSLSPDVVDCIVFWTKNPAEMLDKLDRLKDYHYYFQFTLTPYGKDIEPNVPSKNASVIPCFKRLSDAIGPERVVWRYDPLLLNDTYTIDYHIEYFEKLARKLRGCTEKCTISFIDMYTKIMRNVRDLKLKDISIEEKSTIAKRFSKIAAENSLILDTCSEDIDLAAYGIGHAKCVDDRLIERIAGCRLDAEKDKGQRPECGCVQSIDIGMYNTCLNGCKYCYANYSSAAAIKNNSVHHPDSALLYGELTEDDRVSIREAKSLRTGQTNMFD